jgi:hypothetical protein
MMPSSQVLRLRPISAEFASTAAAATFSSSSSSSPAMPAESLPMLASLKMAARTPTRATQWAAKRPA